MFTSVFAHLKKSIFRGFLAVIPLLLTYLLIRFIYLTIDKKVVDLIDGLIGFRIPGLGIILVLLLLYLLGIVVSHWFGRKIFDFIERVTRRIPLIGTTYQVGKQLETTLTLPEKQIFKRAVLVEYLKPGIWTIGFVTGEIKDQQNPEDLIINENLRANLKRIINILPERQKIILALYFYEELTLADIGRVVGLTEARISQILNKTLVEIKAMLDQ